MKRAKTLWDDADGSQFEAAKRQTTKSIKPQRSSLCTKWRKVITEYQHENVAKLWPGTTTTWKPLIEWPMWI